MLQRILRRAIVLAGLSLSLYTVSVEARVIEQVLAVIDGEPYTLSNLKEYARTKMNREFPVGDLNAIGPEDKEILEDFIIERLLAAEINQAGIKVAAEDIDRYIDQIKEKNRLNDADLAEALRREGMTLEKYRSSVRSKLEQNELINRQVHNRINITAEDVERYYKLNSKKYSSGERVRLRHILFTLPKDASPESEKEIIQKAHGIRRRALAGEDFGKLAQEYSEGAGSSAGGDIGWVTPGSLLKEIEEPAFHKVAVGELSEPVRTSLGIHVIKVDARDPGRILPFSEVKEKIREELLAKALEERYQKWLKTDLRKKHRVDIKIPGVVFRPEEIKEGTVNSLVASSSTRGRSERSGFLSYLNPFSYIMNETPIEGDDAKGELSGRNIVSVLGVPLFTTDSPDATSDGLLPPSQDADGAAAKSAESRGWFSSVINALNPFSSGQ
ncbi:MAG: peptidylprolyl isomerase [Deltaproteobacteria bacterium]|nr:peptidylprolyl isomerase [Deltaproteobacteria bacterium]